VFRALPLAEWAGLFVLINIAYLPLLEEPVLVARFGEPYGRYKKAVRRFLPRLQPWSQDERQNSSVAPPRRDI